MEKKQSKDINTISDNKNRKDFFEEVIKNKYPSSKINSKILLKKNNSFENTDQTLDNAFSKTYPNYSEGIICQKPIGIVKSFSYNSYKGLTKENNEDRVIAVSPIPKPQKTIHRTWPKMSYFAVFDGHGGENCSDYLKNNFLNILIENKSFPHDIKLALTETFEKIEEEILNKNKGKKLNEIDTSGSCALVSIITENKIYFANIGDSRAIMSVNNGAKVKQLTIDHKPSNIKEYERVTKNGGKVYIDDFKDDEHTKVKENDLKFILDKSEFEKYDEQTIFRHFPSDLAVMRSVGDLKAKIREYGGLPGNIIGVPEIFVYDYSSYNDFMIMGCDGIFDDLSNEEIVRAAWHVFKNKSKERNYDINLLSKDSCDMIIKYGMSLLTSDNLSCILIGMEGIQKFLGLKKLKDNKK